MLRPDAVPTVCVDAGQCPALLVPKSVGGYCGDSRFVLSGASAIKTTITPPHWRICVVRMIRRKSDFKALLLAVLVDRFELDISITRKMLWS